MKNGNKRVHKKVEKKMKLVVQIWRKPSHWLMGMKIIANGKKQKNKMLVGKETSKHNPKSMKKSLT